MIQALVVDDVRQMADSLCRMLGDWLVQRTA